MKKVLLVCLFLFYASISLVAQETLHPFYEQNGDCYVLIGTGNARAVWALNNLTTGVAKKLYDPHDAYSITATQVWNGSTDKTLYTFGAVEGLKNVDQTGSVPRHMVVGWSTKIWNFGQVPDKTVHRIHTRPWASVTGLGNHDQTIYGSGTQNKFGNKCIPCDYNPSTAAGMGAVPGKPGWYYYPLGKGYWYHAYDIPAYSNWTYNDNGGAGGPDRGRRTWKSELAYTWNTKESPIAAVANGYYSSSQANADKQPTYGPWCWLTCHADGTHGCTMTMSGWAHRVVKENLKGNYINMKLFSYKVGSGASSPTERETVASNVLASVTGTQDRQGECTDGCIPAVSGVALPGVEQPTLQCQYSPITNRNYMYRRDSESNVGELYNTNGNDTVIGYKDEITTRFLGISSKNSNGNYVYLLGKKIANEWLDAANAPNEMKIADSGDIADVAVSDQWWQTGGIVYIYNKKTKKVLCFARKENAGSQDMPTEIYVNTDGIAPDKIGADGFGNLYMLKTEYVPAFIPPAEVDIAANKLDSYLTKSNIDKIVWKRTETGGLVGGAGLNVYDAIYYQKVYKTVYKRNYTTQAIEKLPGRIELGTNEYRREIWTSDNTITGTPIWASDKYILYGQKADPEQRCEVAVINCPTPPRPENVKSVLDIIGPMVTSDTSATGFDTATADFYCETCKKNVFDSSKENIMYFFMVENPPKFDLNGLNIGNTDLLTDNDSVKGRFPTTIKESTVKYYWKIIQLKDKEHKDVAAADSVVLDMEAQNTSGNYLLYFPGTLEGRFKVGVKVTYQYYDYTKLNVGDLSDKKETCLSTVQIAGKDSKNEYPGQIDENGYAWREIEIIQNPPPPEPEEAGVLMAGTDYSDSETYRPGPYDEKPGSQTDLDGVNVMRFGCPNGCTHTYCKDSEKEPGTTKFVMDGYSLCQHATSKDTWDYNKTNIINWGLRLRETKYNYKNGKNRVASIMMKDPPNPGDLKEIPNTRKWQGDPSATWNVELKKGSDVIYRATPKIINRPYLTLTELRELMPFVSEPYYYEVSVTMNRAYQYEYYKAIPTFYPDGTVSTTYVNVPKIINFKIFAKAEIIVTDNTPPGEYIYKANNPSDSSDTAAVVPGFYLMNNCKYLFGTTGETLEQAGSNPPKIEFIVADNNMFANSSSYEASGFYKKNGYIQDEYRYNTSGIYSRLRVSFNANNTIQKAIFSHGTVRGDMPAGASLKYNGSTGALGTYVSGSFNVNKNFDSYMLTPEKLDGTTAKSLLNSNGYPYYKTLSYVRYSMNLDKLMGFVNNDDTYQKKEMDYYYATTKNGYKNLLFGITWYEACHRQAAYLENTTNDNILKGAVTSGERAGQIVITDNDRPNGIICAMQDKYLGKRYYAPNMQNVNSRTAYERKWIPIMTYSGSANKENGNEKLYVDSTGYHEITNEFKNMTPHPTKAYTDIFLTDFTTNPMKEDSLEINVPVTFVASLTDNISDDGYITVTDFSIYSENGDLITSANLTNYNVDKELFIQHVFRDPGKYYALLKFEDGARSAPSNPDVYHPDDSISTTATGNSEAKDHKKREIRADFVVLGIRFNTRIIERQNQNLR